MNGNSGNGLTSTQEELARAKASEMLEILMRWRMAEDVLCASGVGFRRKIAASRELETAFKAGQDIVDAVLEG